MTGEVGQRERRHPATRGRVDSREQSVAHERHVSAALALVPALLSLLVMIACGAALSRERPWWAQRDDRPIAPRPHGSAWPMLFPVLVLLIAVAVPVTGLVVRAQSVSNLADAWRGARDEVVHSAWLASDRRDRNAGSRDPPRARVGRIGPSAAAVRVATGALEPRGAGIVACLGHSRVARAAVVDQLERSTRLRIRGPFVAIACIVHFAAWLRHSPTSELSARVHGVKTFDRFLRLTVPLRAPATISALVLVSLLVIAELEISLILVRPGPGLSTLAKRRPGELSGGERQRLAFARALAIEPRWLFLDEPTSQLDGPARQELIELLETRLRATRARVILATHQVDLAMRLSDRIAVLLDGRIAQIGTPAEVYDRPANLAVARLLGPAFEMRVGDDVRIVRPHQARFEADAGGSFTVTGCHFAGGGWHITATGGGTSAVVVASDVAVTVGTRGRVHING